MYLYISYCTFGYYFILVSDWLYFLKLEVLKKFLNRFEQSFEIDFESKVATQDLPILVLPTCNQRSSGRLMA